MWEWNYKRGGCMNKVVETVAEAAVGKLGNTAVSEDEDLKAVADALAQEDEVSYGSVPVQKPEDLDASDNIEQLDTEAPKPVIDNNMTEERLIEKETTIGTKTLQDGEISIEDEKGHRLDVPSKSNKNEELLGGTVTKNGRLYHYEGSLGTFDYDPLEWAVGTKDVSYPNGMKATIPVLRYLNRDNRSAYEKFSGSWLAKGGVLYDEKNVGKQLDGNDIQIPDGVKCLDYTFEGIKELKSVPVIPDSVESAHGAFYRCEKLKNFCSNAKVNTSEGDMNLLETIKSGGIGGAVGAGVGTVAWVGGMIAGLGTGGSATAVIAAHPGVIIGGSAMLGSTIIGGGKAKETKNATKGLGGQAACPKNLKDMSGMFADATALTETYESTNSAEDSRQCYQNCVKLGQDKYAMSHGGVCSMDSSESNLSQDAAQDCYDGANVDACRDTSKAYSKYWDSETGTMKNPNLDMSEQKRIEDLAKTIRKENEDKGIPETKLSKETGGVLHKATVRTEKGYKETQNLHDTNYESPQERLLGNFGPFLDRALVSLGEYKILHLLTGNRLIGAVATFGLQTFGLLPKSIKPILDGVAGMLGKDSAVGKVLTSFSGMLGNGANSEVKTHASIARASDKQDLSDTVSEGVSDAVHADGGKMRNQMASAGCQVARSGVLLDAGKRPMSDTEFDQITTMMTTVSAGFADRLEQSKGEDGTVSKNVKTQTAEQALEVLRGFDAYQTSARQEIMAQYSSDEGKRSLAEAGLSKTLAAACAPVLTTVQEMDAKHQLLSKEQQVELDTYVKAFALPEDGMEAASDFDYTDEEAMFGDAYLSDGYEDVRASNPSRQTSYPVPVRTAGFAKTASSGTFDRGKLAEDMAARVGGLSDTGASADADYDYE